jgi:cellulose biosynthesis protein BcsQ
MSVIRSYAIWNNKGGVGKSTITFHLASRYAEKNPDKNVLVIDLCPQSNSIPATRFIRCSIKP